MSSENKVITQIDDLSPEGKELSDKDLDLISGGLAPRPDGTTKHSGRSKIIEGGKVSYDEGFD
jgi:bacteriocin-like protein